jgi:hypothetical protein
MKDESVKYAWDCIWQGLELHIKDKMIYPRVVAYAVATTVAKVNVPLLGNCLIRSFFSQMLMIKH